MIFFVACVSGIAAVAISNATADCRIRGAVARPRWRCNAQRDAASSVTFFMQSAIVRRNNPHPQYIHQVCIGQLPGRRLHQPRFHCHARVLHWHRASATIIAPRKDWAALNRIERHFPLALLVDRQQPDLAHECTLKLGNGPVCQSLSMSQSANWRARLLSYPSLILLGSLALKQTAK